MPLLVDSTLTSPLADEAAGRKGADLVYHSATKFLSGHGTVIGGVVVDGGSFDWPRAPDAKTGKFEELAAPYDGFHGMNFQLKKARWALFCCVPGAKACATSAPA